MVQLDPKKLNFKKKKKGGIVDAVVQFCSWFKQWLLDYFEIICIPLISMIEEIKNQQQNGTMYRAFSVLYFNKLMFKF